MEYNAIEHNDREEKLGAIKEGQVFLGIAINWHVRNVTLDSMYQDPPEMSVDS